MINEEGSGEGCGKIDGSVVHGDWELKFHCRQESEKFPMFS
jgi:hypothetical protein